MLVIKELVAVGTLAKANELATTFQEQGFVTTIEYYKEDDDEEGEYLVKKFQKVD